MPTVPLSHHPLLLAYYLLTVNGRLAQWLGARSTFVEPKYNHEKVYFILSGENHQTQSVLLRSDQLPFFDDSSAV